MKTIGRHNLTSVRKKGANDLHQNCNLLNSFETSESISIYVSIYTKKIFYYGISLDQACYELVYKARTMYSTTDQTDMSTRKSNTKTHSHSDELTIGYKFPFQLNKT